MHFVDMLYYWARSAPHRPAIIQSDLITTYQGLADGIESVAERIDRLNLDKRDPVAVCLANPTFMLTTVFALLRCGYSAAPVNSQYYPLLKGAGLPNLIYDTEGQVVSGGRNIRFDLSWVQSPQQQTTTTRKYRKRPPADASLIFFTSGTTGFPKKVVQPSAALDQRLRYSGYVSESRQKVLIMPGLISAVGLNRVCEVLNVGRTACFAPDSLTALSLINLFGIEIVVASTAQALGLADTKIGNPGYRVDTLKDIFVSGGKIGSDGIARIQTVLCRNIIHQYGSTEAGMVGRTPFDVLDDTSSVIVFPWVDLEVVNEAGEQLPAEAEGNVRIRTPQSRENFEEAKTSAPEDQNGWLYPGDIGAISEEGVLRLAGRSSDVLNRGGVKISGARVEEILNDMPEIKDAAACGIDGPSGLQEIWIAIVTNGAVDIDSIKIHLRKHQDVGITPDEVFIVDHIPRSDRGKIQKHLLTELLLSKKTGS